MTTEWYRRSAWSPEDKDEFFARLGRSRDEYNKAQYLRIQAGHIEEEYPEAAMELLEMIVEEYPVKTQLAQSYLQMAQCFIRQGLFDSAIGFFRKTLEQEREFPNVRTNAWLDYPMFAILRERKDLYEEVENILSESEERLMFPLDRYRFHAALAIISEDKGKIEDATRHAREALEAASADHSGLPYHPQVGLVESEDAKIHRKLSELSSK